jgi:glycosyltransferase involved in cell wall biosynthesis
MGALFSSALAFSALPVPEALEFVIVIPSYNNEKWCIENIASCLNQTYPYFTVYYIDDCSRDRTGELVERYVTSRRLGAKCTIIHNTERRGALANLYSTISMIDPKKIVVTVDGDDTLESPEVLTKLAAVYADRSVWMTYGNYKRNIPPYYFSCCEPFPQAVAKHRTFRSYKWVASHLRTFYAGLFQRIKKEDLLWKGKFFPMTWDLAFMMPMLEMASRGHFRFIKDVLYVYRITNPLNDFRVNEPLQRNLDEYIRKKPPYPALEILF